MSKKSAPSKDARDNRANQLNPNNDAYWKSRGEPGKPHDTGSPPSGKTPGKSSR